MREIEANPVLSRVQQILVNQTTKGLEKYGHTVQPNALSTNAWIDHASEEIVDLLVYLQVLKERSLQPNEQVVLSTEQYNSLVDENQRLREALTHIATRKMSCYLTRNAMMEDFIKTATGALEGET